LQSISTTSDDGHTESSSAGPFKDLSRSRGAFMRFVAFPHATHPYSGSHSVLRFNISNNSRKSRISRKILGIARCTFGVQLDANTRKCTSRPIANHGAQSSSSDVCRRDNARECETRPFARRLPSTRRQKTTTNSVTELSCTALCVVETQEEDDKFRDGFVTATRNCYTLAGNGPVPVCNEHLGLEWCIYCLILLYSRQVLSGS
jgi:hypothetical protein